MNSFSICAQELSKDILDDFSKIQDAVRSAGRLSSINCNDNNAILDRSVLTSPYTVINDIDISLSLISEDYAKELFDEIASLEHIPFKYPEDGCTARAHEMSRYLDDKGIITGKAFLEGDLRVATGEGKRGYIEWWFHVAPIVKVNKNGKILVYVFDPSIFSKPVPLEEWIDKQTKHKSSGGYTSYQTKRYNYAPYQKYYNLKDYTENDIRESKKVIEKYTKVLIKREEKIQKKELKK